MADAKAAPPVRPLDEVMLAMDVVDTLRHRQKLVAQELARPESDEELRARLRQIYAAQGIEVSDDVLREGVAALREDRFAYKPPPDTWAVRWARLYVQRGLWARRALLVVIAVLLVVGAYRLVVVAPREALAADIESRHAAIVELAADTDVRQRADTLHEQARAAMSTGDLSRARAGLAELEELLAQLERSYDLVIATGPDSAVGVWRIPDVNEAARNYYLIVQAVDPRGQRVTLPVRNEETGATERVSTFGLGVTEATWERVAADLEDDGLIQNDVVAVKERGELEPQYQIETTGGAITRW